MARALKKRTIAVALAAVITAAAGVLLAGSVSAAPPQAQAVTVGIDVDPAGNTATSLGSIDRCASIPAGGPSQFTIDVFVDAIPAGEDMAGFNYLLNFDASRFRIVDRDHSFLLTSAGGSVIDLGDEVPDATSPHTAAAVNLSGSAPAGPAAGVLGRYTIEVLSGAANGAATFSLPGPDLDMLFNSSGREVDVSQVMDGVVALGEPCPSNLPPPRTRGVDQTTAGETPQAGETPGAGDTAGDGETPGEEETPGADGEAPGPGTPGAAGESADATPTATGEAADNGDGGQSDDDDDGLAAWLIITIIVAGIATAGTAGGGVWWWRRRRTGGGL